MPVGRFITRKKFPDLTHLQRFDSLAQGLKVGFSTGDTDILSSPRALHHHIHDSPDDETMD